MEPNNNAPIENEPKSGGPIDIDKVKQLLGSVQEWCSDPRRKQDLLNRLESAKGAFETLIENVKSFTPGEKTAGKVPAEGNGVTAESPEYESMLTRTVHQCMDLFKAAAPKVMELERQAMAKLKSDETADKIKGVTDSIRRRLADLLLTGLDQEPKKED